MHMCISPLLPCSLSFFLLLLIRLCLCKFFQIMIPYYCFASFLRYLICQQIHYYFSLFLLSYDLFLNYACHLELKILYSVDVFLDMLMMSNTKKTKNQILVKYVRTQFCFSIFFLCYCQKSIIFLLLLT